MMIIGCDYHPGFQQIAFVDTETGELQERRLQHREEAEKFYRELAAQGNEGACGDGSQWTCALVRASAGRTELRVVDRGRHRDRQEARTQAEDGSPGCTAHSALAAEGYFSTDLGSGLGEAGA